MPAITSLPITTSLSVVDHSLMSEVEAMADAVVDDSHAHSSELAQPQKSVEEEKVQEESPPSSTDPAPAPAVQPRTAEEEQKEPETQPQKVDGEQEKVADAGGAEDDVDGPARSDSTSTRPPADAIYNDSSDSDDDEGEPLPPSTLPSIPPTTDASTAPHPHNPYLHLEEEIEEEDKRDRECAIPHLSSISFDTPKASSPTTPFLTAPSESAPSSLAPAVPFRFDPTLVLIPDVDHFVRSSLPLLYPKLTLTLSTPSTPLHTRLAALSTCVDLSRDPLHHPHLIEHGVLDELLLNSTAPHPPIRLLCLTSLLHLVPHLTPRAYCLSHGLVPA